MVNKRILLLSIITFSWVFVFAQEQEDLSSLFKVDYDTPLTIDLAEKKELYEDVEVKKKVKRNTYMGYKIKKLYTRTGSGDNVVFELFTYLKEYEGPAPYTRDFYWYDYKKKKIVNSLNVDPKNGVVLHGHYEKTLGDQVLEEGYFYKGMKHKRWVRSNSYDILQDKKYYWKGWPEESLLSYYDYERTKLKEVVPIHYGERGGEYWAFHPDGNVAVRGAYEHNNKVGVWREYYPNKRLKREISYPEDPFNFDHKVVILAEWDRNGQKIYDRAEYLKSLN